MQKCNNYTTFNQITDLFYWEAQRLSFFQQDLGRLSTNTYLHKNLHITQVSTTSILHLYKTTKQDFST